MHPETPAPTRRATFRELMADDLTELVGLALASLPLWQRQSVLMASRAAGWDLANLSSVLDRISDRSLEVIAARLSERLIIELDFAGARRTWTDAERVQATAELRGALGK